MKPSNRPKSAVLGLPGVLVVQMLGSALGACAPGPAPDAGTDVATVDDQPAGCHAVMPGRQCVTTCSMLGDRPDGAGPGVITAPCEVYCSADPSVYYCYDVNGQMTPCERGDDGDGGSSVFC